MSINLSALKSWRGDLLALAAGAIMPFAFAPFNYFVLALLSLGIIMLCWAKISPKRAFARGWLYGLAMYGIGVSWVHISMNQFGGLSVPLSLFLTALFVMFLSLFPAITGYAARRLSDHGTHQLAREYVLIIPAFWVLFEWIKGNLFTGFPWLTLGYSQIDTPISGYAPLFGVYFVSYIVVILAGIIIYWILSGRSATKRALPGLVLLVGLPAILNQVSWSDPVDRPLKISLVQGNIPQDQKWLPQQRKPTLDLYSRLSREHWDSDLVIWPETAIPAFYHQVYPFLKNIAQEARMNGSELLVGLPVYNDQEKVYYNAMLSLGQHEKFYEKIHLVPFGEYLPLKQWLGDIIDFFNIPLSNFSPGRQEKPLLTLAGQTAGITICYEDVFGEEVANALPEATFLVNASNLAWFGDSVASPQHLQIARMRALEMARYSVRATNTGVSAIIDNKGNVIAQSPRNTLHVLTGNIQPMSGMTVYAVLTNIPVMMLSIILIGVAFWLGRRKD